MSLDRNDAVARDEEGSALILALVMITVVAMLLAVVLDFTGTTATATPELVTSRDNLNEVDGAVDAAINSIRGSMGLGSEGFSVACAPGAEYDADPADAYDVTVECHPQSGSGSTADDVPRYAILLLGTGGLSQTGNALLTVDGGIYSHGPVTQAGLGSSNQRELQVYGDLLAEEPCTAVDTNSIVSFGGLFQCKPDFAGDPSGDDPGYTPFKSAAAITSEIGAGTMAVDPTATCPGNGFVRFSPGLYTEVPVAPSSCTSDVWWFQPGFYYFDFASSSAIWKPASAASNKYVVGGSLDPSLPTTTSASVVKTTWLGKACDENASGVQFVFGGSSRISIDNGGFMELCGSADVTGNDNQRIVFYGLNNTYGPRTTKTDQALAVAGTPTSATTGLTQWFNPAFAASTESPVALSATATVTGSQTSNLTIPGFADVPKGARITGLKLKVRHFATTDKAASKIILTLPVTPARSTTTTEDYDLNDCLVTLCDDIIPVPLTDLGSSFTYQDINGLSATIQAAVQGNNTITENVDSVELLVSYQEPGYEASSCPSGPLTCSVLETTVQESIFFHGTVYVPTSKLDLTVHNTDKTIFGRGVIADSLEVQVSASSTQTESPFQLPSATTGRKVLFVGKVNGAEKVRALVSYQDFNMVDGQKLAFPGYKVTVERWSVIR